MNKFYFSICMICILLLPLKKFGQCTPEKEPKMKEYLEKTQTQDAQGCSQCGMLALYLCSARYSVKSDDVQKVGQLISACKTNIITMGQPYCCPELVNATPQWGSMAGGSSAGVSTTGSSGGLTPAPTTNSQLLNALTTIDPKNKGLNEFAQNYAQGEQLSQVANGLIDMFSPSPEEKARKEKEKQEAAQRAEEYRQAQIKLALENEQNAKTEFNALLKKYPPTNVINKNILVLDIMDQYIANKYNYDSNALIPEWQNWMKESIASNDRYASIVFAGKALGYNYNKFQYSIGLTNEEAIKLLEKVGNEEDVLRPIVGITYDEIKKTITEKNKKKKTSSKEVKTFKITHIAKGSAAEKAGLKENDVILKVNNAYLNDFSETIQKNKVGDKIALTILSDSKETVKEITIGGVKNNYKADAILFLAHYYNTKDKGNDPEKALYYFTKAAENGSPNAMFALGEIYQNNVFGNKKTNVKFKFKKNEEFALDWYLKSIQNTEYSYSKVYATYKIGSYFEPQSFDELIVMYKKGIGCKKSPEKADEILALKNAYLAEHPSK